MEIHNKFLEILEEKGLIKLGNLEELSGKIGIDGEWWINFILPKDTKAEMMGSITMTLRPSILNSLKQFSNFDLSPVIVLPGITLFNKSYASTSKLWAVKAEGVPTASLNSFSPTKHFEMSHTISEIIKICKAETFRAPYLSAPQLAFFAEKGVISNVLGMADLIFYDVKKIIVETLQTKFKYINSDEVLGALGITANELKQAFVLKGYCGKVYTEMPLSVILDTLKYVRIENLASDKLAFNEHWSIIDCNVSLGFDPPGLNYKEKPDVKAYGNRLPKELYFAISVLNASPELLNVLTHSKIVEKPPTCESNNYRRMLRSLKDLKSSTVSILASTLDPAYSRSPVKIMNWYSEIQDELPIKPLSSLKWKVTPLTLSQSLSQLKKNYPDLQFCLKWHLEDYNGKKDLLSPSDNSPQIDAICIQAKVYFIFLENIGYIFSNGVPSLFGKAFISVDPEWQYSAIYLLELLKYGLLNGRTLSQSQCGQITNEQFEKLCGISTDDNSRHAIVLISRVFSLVQPTLKEELWTGEIDYDLAQFHSLINLIYSTYHQNFEAIVVKEFLSTSGFNRNLKELCKKSPMLPYPNPALGIAVKRLLMCDDVGQVAMEMPQMADLFCDLQRGWMFWRNFVKVMNVFKQYNAVPENTFMNDISSASKKLKNALLRARIQVSS